MCKTVFWPFLTLFPKCTGPHRLRCLQLGPCPRRPVRPPFSTSWSWVRWWLQFQPLALMLGGLEGKLVWENLLDGWMWRMWEHNLKGIKDKGTDAYHIYIYMQNLKEPNFWANFEVINFVLRLWIEKHILNRVPHHAHGRDPPVTSWFKDPLNQKIPSTNPVNLFIIHLT